MIVIGIIYSDIYYHHLRLKTMYNGEYGSTVMKWQNLEYEKYKTIGLDLNNYRYSNMKVNHVLK